ncbi:uncharacterized protein PAC_13571 [Phialocephala subalpina]|uniref:Uncharacterized protein n=1 Tax=Phialocephala subalpina TaxID=576137 RepID=A0A1L7XF71_9HELO|nr:uncharacterized protein PAC_13571 [Phialocephala subalpina]
MSSAEHLEFLFDKEIVHTEVYRHVLAVSRNSEARTVSSTRNVIVPIPVEPGQCPCELQQLPQIKDTDFLASQRDNLESSSPSENNSEPSMNPLRTTTPVKFIEEREATNGVQTWLKEQSPSMFHDESEGLYASTIPSKVVEEDSEGFQTDARQDHGGVDSVPSTPDNFRDFFPTTRRLSIHHDDTTSDGHHNLRIETRNDTLQSVQLFHLRMHDLRTGDFSLRRYERNLGLEVCRSIRKTKSLNFVLLKAGGDQDGDGQTLHEFPIPLNTIAIEFSDYATLHLKRRGHKSERTYEFEYWGTEYIWERLRMRARKSEEYAYHLFRGSDPSSLAHIVPDFHTSSDNHDAEAREGWIQPSMWISDQSVIEALTGTSDVIAATGLIALVDSCINRTLIRLG